MSQQTNSKQLFIETLTNLLSQASEPLVVDSGGFFVTYFTDYPNTISTIELETKYCESFRSLLQDFGDPTTFKNKVQNFIVSNLSEIINPNYYLQVAKVIKKIISSINTPTYKTLLRILNSK